jgi:putative ABC transport system permease protein
LKYWIAAVCKMKIEKSKNENRESRPVDWRQEIKKQLASLQLAPTHEAEIVEELAQHLEDCYAEQLLTGASPQEAYRATLDELPEAEVLKRQLRRFDARKVQEVENVVIGRSNLMGDFWQDLRYGGRRLRRHPGFTFVVILTLALGIGANTAIFSIVRGVLLKPLGFSEPERLFMIWADNPSYQLGFHEFPPANADLPEWRKTATSFEQIGAFQTKIADLSTDGEPERVGGVCVTVNLLPMLGAQPLLGRQFSDREEQPRADRVALISYDLWQRRFGADAQILGKTIKVNDVSREIIGVMPAGFNFPRATEMPHAYNLPDRSDIWVPLARDAEYWQNQVQRQLVVLVGRLQAGVTEAQAQAEMDTIAARQALDHPESHAGWRVWLAPLFRQMIGQTRMPLLVLLGAVGFLLLIACANIASLLLAQAATRRQEMAVRAAIGAGRGRIIRQLLTESLLLALLGGSVGSLFGYFGLKVLLNFIPSTMPRLHEVTFDGQVFLFTAGLAVLTGVLFGLVPAWQTAKVNLAETLKDAARSSSAGRGVRSHSLLVMAEVALAVVLLIGAALMLQSFNRLTAVDPGFKAEGVATFEVCLPWARYDEGPQRAEFFEQACARLSNLPGVRAVGVVSKLPLTGNESMSWFVVEGAEPVPPGKEPLAEYRVMTPGYFEAMGVGLVSGRNFDARDAAGKLPVAIVNESFARKFFPDGNALGKRIKRVLDDKEWRTIVGVVRDVRSFALEVEARPQLYHPYIQEPWSDAMTVTIRADGAALPALRSAIQQEVKQLDAAVPIAKFELMPQLLSKAVARPRFISLLLGLFAATALLLTVVGLYGVVAYGVSQRRREIGIRLALGARPTNVLALVIRQGLQPAIIGLGIGLTGAFVLMRLLESQLYEVKATDPLTFTVVAFGLLMIAVLACYLPARRATKVDPMMALRGE